MVEVEYLSIAEFAGNAGVSKQAIYKQLNNPNSQIAPFVMRVGKKVYIKKTALTELYGVDFKISTNTTQYADKNTTFTTVDNSFGVEKTTLETTQDNQKEQPAFNNSTEESQPLSTDYIEFLKAQVAELKAEKAEVEQRLNATIQEKDSIIKDQTAQLAQLAQQVAEIANKALITTSQQQALTAAEKADKQEPPAEEIIVDSSALQETKKSFWKRLFR